MSNLREVLIGAALSGFSYTELARIKMGEVRLDTSELVRRAKEFDGKAITILDSEYPSRLLRLTKPPIVLFYKGNWELVTKPSVAIVGTRRASRYGLEVAAYLASRLAEAGIVIVSGLARGIDATAHSHVPPETAIAVLGNGYDVFYPSSSRKLQQEISEKGLIVSEYPPDATGTRWTYVARDRIIAALSDMVVVVESPLGGGALHTARFALDMGIPVGAVPGDIFRKQSVGSNELLKDGAHVITSPDDILSVIGITGGGDVDGRLMLSREEEDILQILSSGEMDLYELSATSGMPVGKLLGLITKLESKGLVSFDGSIIGRRS